MGPIAINVAHYWAMKFLTAADRALIEAYEDRPGSRHFHQKRCERRLLLQHYQNYFLLGYELVNRYAH